MFLFLAACGTSEPPDSGTGGVGDTGEDVAETGDSGDSGDSATGDTGTIDIGAVAKLSGDAPGDGGDLSAASAGDLNGDGYEDVVVGFGRNERGGSAAGTAYVFYGPVVGTRDVGGADVRLVGAEGDTAHVVASGDTNGDGAPDLIIGAPSGSYGLVYVVEGPFSVDRHLPTSAALLSARRLPCTAGPATAWTPAT